MESNGVGGIFVGWGMSIASKRAKERQKRSSDELVMAKTKFQPSQCQGYPHIRVYVWMIRVRQPDFYRVVCPDIRGDGPADPGGSR